MTVSSALPGARAWALAFVCFALTVTPIARAQDAPDSAARERPTSIAPSSSAAPAADGVGPALMDEDELSNVELRLWQLRHERAQMLAPLTLVVAGYGAALVGTAAAFTTFAFAEQVQHRQPEDAWRQRLDVNNDDRIDRDDERAFRRMARTFAAISGVGAAIGVVGTVLLANALRDHPEYGAEIRSLRQRRRELRRHLEYGAGAYPGGMALSLRGRFF